MSEDYDISAPATARPGFTLIELLVVIIIVGILASVAVPILRSAKNKAIATEAVSALGAIRTAARLYYMEYDSYPTQGSQQKIYEIGLGFKPGDLNGLYFSEDCYSVYNAPPQFDITCCLDVSDVTKSPKAGELRVVFQLEGGVGLPEMYIWMDKDGNITTNIKDLKF